MTQINLGIISADHSDQNLKGFFQWEKSILFVNLSSHSDVTSLGSVVCLL